MNGLTNSEPCCYSSKYRLEFFGEPVYDQEEPKVDLAVPMDEPTRIINVASVPQRSPFRYPGGKTWLVPYARRWLRSQSRPVGQLVEPFAGGGIVGLTAAFERLAKRVTLIEDR